MILIHARCSVNAIYLKLLWDQLRFAYAEVNSGGVENFDEDLKQLTTAGGVLVMLA